MKTRQTISTVVLTIFSITLIISCSKDDSDFQPNGTSAFVETQGISLDDLDTYAGQIGISISTREIAKKGHKPTTAILSIATNSGNIEETVPIDPDLNIAQLSFEVNSLNEAVETELISGVPVNVTIKDNNNNTLVTDNISIVSFTANPQSHEVNAIGLPDSRDGIAFKENVKYYMQIVDEDFLNNYVTFVNYITGGSFSRPVQLRANYDYSDTNLDKNRHQFTFVKIPNEPGSFAIISGVTSGTNHLFLRMYGNYLFQDNSRHVETTNLNTLPAENRFKFKRVENNGTYTISPVSNNVSLRRSIVNNTTRLNNFGNMNDALAYFRILTLDIDWDIEALTTKQLVPILPAATSGFAYNSKLSNCTSGTLTQEISIQQTETTTSQASFEESFSMTSSQSVSKSLTVGVSVETSFFGAGVTGSVESTASYEQEIAITNTSTQYVSETNTDEQTLFSSRIIEIPPGTAANVYDAFQTYNNIKVPFVQKYRIRGLYITGEGALTGDEVLTQFLFTNFNNGVVTEIGQDYIELTVRGVNNIGNLVDAISKAEATNPECN